MRRAHIGRGTAITEDDGLDPVSSNPRLFKHCMKVGCSDKCRLMGMGAQWFRGCINIVRSSDRQMG